MKISFKKAGSYLSFFILCLVYSPVWAQFINLSDQASISILTPEPGQESIETIYGHSAIRVNDPGIDLDIVFDYGLFDFDDPNFALNFAKGYLNYSVGSRPYEYFIRGYMANNRTIHEQVMNLNQNEIQDTFEYLATNALPENKYYYYDYFYDNCATRIRDVFMEVLGEKLQFDENYVTPKHSFRQMVDSLSIYQPWGEFGIDICLGLPMDKKMSPMEYMFLPGYVYQAFQSATILRGGNREPAIKSEFISFQASPQSFDKGTFTPKTVFWLLFIVTILISYAGYKKDRNFFGYDLLLLSVFGLIGLLLTALWAFTDHNAAANNLNILWAMPTHLVGVIFLIRKHKPPFVRYYFLTIGIIMGLVLITWPINPQGYNPAFFPIVASLGFRSGYIFMRLKAKK